MSEFNPFKMAQAQLDEATKLLGLDPSTCEFLRWPMREYKVTVPVRMDSGKTKIFHAYRVQYNSSRGPTKGGLRWHPDETIDTVRALAAWMTWKTALVNLPLGGGKGGVTCNPKEMSEAEKERLARGYIRQVAPLLKVTKDVPAPDVYTNPQIMAWMMDEFETISQEHHPGVITGKPLELGGSAGRSDATARGGIYTVREAAAKLDIPASNLRYAIQGFGNAGQFAALLHKEILKGGTLVAASDSRGGVVNLDGLNAEALVKYKKETGSLSGFPGSEPITNEKLLELEVDVLYPAALENSITEKNAAAINTKILCELANGPVTPIADKILFEKGIFVIPDFLANAGGVTVSYFEQVQNTYNYYWPLSEVHDKLDETMTAAFESVYQTQKQYKVHNRLAAYIVAVSRVAEACKLRGWV
jgi:glutamate dehydrogenase (NAD(P)+)